MMTAKTIFKKTQSFLRAQFGRQPFFLDVKNAAFLIGLHLQFGAKKTVFWAKSRTQSAGGRGRAGVHLWVQPRVKRDPALFSPKFYEDFCAARKVLFAETFPVRNVLQMIS